MANDVALTLTADNPLPGRPDVVALTTEDGRLLRLVHWPAAVPDPKGTVCLIQGRAEFVEKYFETAGELLARGFCVVAFDWRGQGGSARDLANARKGHVDDFSLYHLDLRAVAGFIDRHCPAPVFGLAHSMGGAIALSALHAGIAHFTRLVTTAPMIRIGRIRFYRGAQVLAEVLDGIGLGTAFIPGGSSTSIVAKPFAGNPLTADPRRYRRHAAILEANPALAIGDPTIGWVNAAFRCMAAFAEPRYAPSLATPVLVVAAGHDSVVSTPAIERFCARLKTGHAIVVPGALHEILMERDSVRDAFWAAFDAFVPGSPAGARAAAAVSPQPASSFSAAS